ncbi:MAG: serine/threonine-protein kinase [Acidobacteriota bacterium]
MHLSGKRFGHIRVTEPLGEGGMGAVYAGFDETLRRRVAVKVLQDDQRLDPEARARLIREARSLSQLDHPNICRIHDYIEGEEVDLLVLEYIEGTTLQESIEKGLTPAEKLRIAAAIAEVLIVAHRAGIVHRDLKPDNVMLTPAGQVKVLDFGLARWVEDRRTPRPVSPRLQMVEPENLSAARTHPASASAGAIHHLTEAGITMGTPFYMSPEQARGETLSPASDMYSFGLVLQTLFTGREPYDAELTPREVMLKAARGNSRPVSGAGRDVTLLINTLKSLAPTDRLTAAEALLRIRLIAGKTKRLVQRGLAALVIVLLLIGVAKYTFDLRRERAAAIAAERKSVVATEEAATRRGQAEELINFMLGDLRRKLEPLGKLDLLDDVGERALAYSGSLRPELMSGVEVARNAKALNQLGEVRIAQGRLPEAASIFARARTLATVAAKKDPADQNAQLALMAAYYGEGETARRAGDAEGALRLNERYLATAMRLAAASPQNAEYRIEQAYAHANVGALLMGLARYGEARPHFEEALRIKRIRLARDPLNLEWQADLANTINKVGVNLLRTGDLAGARLQFTEQKRIHQVLVGVAPEHAQWKSGLATSHAFLSSLLINMGMLNEARRETGEELRIARSLVSTDPENTSWQRNLAMTTARVAMLDGWLGQSASSDRGFHDAEGMLADLVLRDAKRASHTADLAATDSRSALSRLRRGEVGRAYDEWRRGRDLLQSNTAAATNRQVTLEVWVTGLTVAHAAGQRAAFEESRRSAEELLAAPALASSSDPEVIALRARLLVSTGRREEAGPWMTRLAASGYHQPDYEWIVRPQ